MFHSDKFIVNSIISLILLCGFNTSLIAQTTLNIQDDLKANSIPIKIKRKGISAIGKYEFDQYQLISGKSGVTTTKSKTSFKSASTSTSKAKKSFVFLNKNKDSVIANISINSNAEILVDSIIDVSIGNVVTTQVKNNFFNRTFFDWRGRALSEGSETYATNFFFLKNNSAWELLMVYPIYVEVDGEYQMDNTTQFKAALTNGEIEIEIKQITQIEGTKISFLGGPVAGYEFYLNEKAMAAVQYNPINKLYIWLHQDLDEEMKFVISAVSTSLLIKEFN